MASPRVPSGFAAKDVLKAETAGTSAAIAFQPLRSRFGKANDAKNLRVAILGRDQKAENLSNACIHLCYRVLSNTVGATTLEMALAWAKSGYANSVGLLKGQAQQGQKPAPQGVEGTETNGASGFGFLAPKDAFEQFYNGPGLWNLKEGGQADWDKESVCMPFETNDGNDGSPLIYEVFKGLIRQRWSKPCCRKLLLTIGGEEGHTIIVLWQNGKMFFLDTLSHGGFRNDSGRILHKHKALCIAAESVAELETVLEYYLVDRRGWSRSGLQREEVQSLEKHAAQTGKGLYTSYHIDLSFYTGVEEGFWPQQDPQASEENSKKDTSEEEQSEETMSNAPRGHRVVAGEIGERPRSREEQLAAEDNVSHPQENLEGIPETHGEISSSRAEGRSESEETSGEGLSDSERAHLEEERLELQQQKEEFQKLKEIWLTKLAEEKKRLDEQMKEVNELQRQTMGQKMHLEEKLKAAAQDRGQEITNLETRMRRDMEESAAREREAEGARLAAEKEVEALKSKMQEESARSAEETKQIAEDLNAAKEGLRDKERETQRLVEELKQAEWQNKELEEDITSLRAELTCEEEKWAQRGANAVSRTPVESGQAEWTARAPKEDQKPRADPEFSSLGPDMDLPDDRAHKEQHQIDGRGRMPVTRTHAGGAADGPEACASWTADSARGDDDRLSSRHASLSADKSSSGGGLVARCKPPPKRKLMNTKALNGSAQKKPRRMKWDTFWPERVQTLSDSFRVLHRSRQRDQVSKCQHKDCEKERGRGRTYCDACNAAFCTWNQAQCWVDHHQELLAKYLEKEKIKAREEFDAAAAASGR